MNDSWPLLDLADIERRAETGDIDRTDVRALVADVRRKRTALAAAETARDDWRDKLAMAGSEFDVLRAERDGHAETARRLRGTLEALAPLLEPEPDEDPNGYSEGTTLAYYDGRTKGRNDLREEIAGILGSDAEEPET